MTTQQQSNEELVRSLLTEVFAEHRLEAATEYLAADAVVQNGMHSYDSAAAWRESHLAPAVEVATDHSITIEDLFGAGDSVAFRFADRGTLEGEYQGRHIPGEEYDVSVIGIATVENGEITELRYEFDRLLMLQQLDLLPESA